jgi:conjugative transfer signal peptidase TraF
MEGLWEKARGSVSVVGQDKGSASQWRVPRGFRWYSYDLHTRHSGAHASLCGTPRASQYRVLKKPFLPMFWRVPGGLIAAAAGIGSVIFTGWFFHVRITPTDSAAPAGIYRLSAAPIGRGALVAACLPAAIERTGRARGYLAEGDCPAGAEPVAKVIGALPGDELQIEPGFVAVDGVKFPNSQTAARDSAGRLLAHVLSGAYRVGAGEVWLFGFNNRRSWDARYFGPVPLANVRGVLRPLVTW